MFATLFLVTFDALKNLQSKLMLFTKKFYIFFFLLISSIGLFSQEVTRIKGRVIDAATKEEKKVEETAPVEGGDNKPEETAAVEETPVTAPPTDEQQ